MRIVIDENGRVIEGSAAVMTIVNEAGTVLPRWDSHTPVALRTFQCPECEELIEARTGRQTVHECTE